MRTGELIERRRLLAVEYVGDQTSPCDLDLYEITFGGEPPVVVWLHEDPEALPSPGQEHLLVWATVGDGMLDPSNAQRVAVCLLVHLEGLGQFREYKWLPWRYLGAARVANDTAGGIDGERQDEAA